VFLRSSASFILTDYGETPKKGSLMTIKMLRVDDRLIHGQVVMKWTRTIGANLIIVPNDKVAKDPLQQSLMRMAAPPGVNVELLPVDEAAQKLVSGAWSNKSIFVIVRDPLDLLRLLEAGLQVGKVNIGNASGGTGKVRLSKVIHATPEELQAWKKLDEMGIILEAQALPGEGKSNINQVLQKLA
jgi:mannose/fructose/N-acetylgalactosamine-specific phosphotransferase system component IIB